MALHFFKKDPSVMVKDKDIRPVPPLTAVQPVPELQAMVLGPVFDFGALVQGAKPPQLVGALEIFRLTRL